MPEVVSIVATSTFTTIQSHPSFLSEVLNLLAVDINSPLGLCAARTAAAQSETCGKSKAKDGETSQGYFYIESWLWMRRSLGAKSII